MDQMSTVKVRQAVENVHGEGETIGQSRARAFTTNGQVTEMPM